MQQEATMITRKFLTFNSVLLFSLIHFVCGASVVSIYKDTAEVNALGLGEFVTVNNHTSTRPSVETYFKRRQNLIYAERALTIGADIALNSQEILANNIIMSAKNEEINAGFKNPFQFIPSRHLFEVLSEIRSSKLFNLIKQMPKGGVLHAHDISLCSTDYVISLTYRQNLWECRKNHSIIFKFSRISPVTVLDCEWNLVSKERKLKGKEIYDKELRKHFSLYTEQPGVEYKDINEVWRRFINIFITVGPILTYVPVWRDYYKRALEEFYADNVQYLEFRGTLPKLYDLDGKSYEGAEVVQIYYDTLNEFKKEHPGFIGSKFIYGPSRKVNNSTFSEYMTRVVNLQKQFPDFVAGFDLVGQEDLGRPLVDYIEGLLSLPDNINFFFHAGETKWYGSSTDENLIDAILLGTKRIGHGYAIPKHPIVLETVKERGIAIEVNAISNQVLKLNSDNRNHPCSFLFANNYPVVISSDDPSFWEATPLSHDFYIAFLGIASAHSDLRTLKQLAINSIAYSSLNSAEKKVAFSKWQVKWDEYIEWLVQDDNSPFLSNLVQ